MSSILKAELQIVGSDKTAAAFAGVIKHAEELRATLGKIGTMSAGTAAFKEQSAAIKQSTAALRSELSAVQAINRAISLGNAGLLERSGMLQRMRQRIGGMAEGLGMYGWMAGGYAAGRTLRAAAHDTAEFEHQRAMLATTSGMSRAEVEEAVRTAQRINVPLMSAAENLKSLGELRMVFGSTEHAIANVESVQRAAAMLKAVNPGKNADAEAYDLARALELKGVSMDPQHFNRLNNAMVQAVNASRGKITGESFFEFTQYARGAARGLSDFFYSRIAPSLIQEMRPTSAGRAISSLYEQVVGGKMKLQAATEWMKLGLLDPHKVDLNKIGTVKRIHPGAFVDSALFVSDPYAWIQKYLAPALKKHGITEPAKVSEELAHLFSNMYAEQMAGILLTQKQRIEKDAGMALGAPGIEALENVRRADPKAALTDLAGGINSLLAALGSPLAGTAIGVMNKLSDAARAFARGYGDLAKNSPVAAELLSTGAVLGLGYAGLKGVQATFGVLTGATALKGSALALDRSAAALSAAAGRLGAGSVPGVMPSGVPLGLGLVPGVTTAMQLYQLQEEARAKAAKLPSVTWAEWWDSKFGGGVSDFPRADFAGTSMRDFIRDNGLASIPTVHPGGIGSDYAGALRDGSIKAELEGSAQIRNTIEVKPSPEFWTTIRTFIDNGIRSITVDGIPGGGTSGSTGSAMPEALPTGAHK